MNARRLRVASRLARTLVVAALAAAPLLAPGLASAAGAQESDPPAPSGAQLGVTDAFIDGSGPWTTWLGAPSTRRLVLTVTNIGTTPIEDPTVTLRFGKGGSPSEPVVAPTFGRLEPGATATVFVELELPWFAFGTYAVEGSFAGLTNPVGFRAETSHVPWLAFALPLIILTQLGLLWLRNRVRDRIHRTPATSDPTLPPPRGPEPDLETIIGEELDHVFDNAALQFDDSREGDDVEQLLTQLAAAVAARTHDRLERSGATLSYNERATLHRTLVAAVLDAFGARRSEPEGTDQSGYGAVQRR